MKAGQQHKGLWTPGLRDHLHGYAGLRTQHADEGLAGAWGAVKPQQIINIERTQL